MKITNQDKNAITIQRGEYEYTINFNGDDEFYVDVTTPNRPNEYASTVNLDVSGLNWYEGNL